VADICATRRTKKITTQGVASRRGAYLVRRTRSPGRGSLPPGCLPGRTGTRYVMSGITRRPPDRRMTARCFMCGLDEALAAKPRQWPACDEARGNPRSRRGRKGLGGETRPTLVTLLRRLPRAIRSWEKTQTTLRALIVSRGFAAIPHACDGALWPRCCALPRPAQVIWNGGTRAGQKHWSPGGAAATGLAARPPPTTGTALSVRGSTRLTPNTDARGDREPHVNPERAPSPLAGRSSTIGSGGVTNSSCESQTINRDHARRNQCGTATRGRVSPRRAIAKGSAFSFVDAGAGKNLNAIRGVGGRDKLELQGLRHDHDGSVNTYSTARLQSGTMACGIHQPRASEHTRNCRGRVAR